MATAVDLTNAPCMPPAENALFAATQWSCWHSVANGALSATHAAVAGQQHFVKQIIIKTDGAVAAATTFTLKSGSTLLLTIPWATDDRTMVVNIPGAGTPMTQGAAVNIDMGSTGGATVGMIYASGYTTNAP